MRIRISIFSLLVCTAMFSNIACNQQKANVSLNHEVQFLNPPTSAKPYVLCTGWVQLFKGWYHQRFGSNESHWISRACANGNRIGS